MVKHHGFDGGSLNDTVMNEEEEYVGKHPEDRPLVETAYYQKKADAMKLVLVAFWQERGVEVEVCTSLKPVPSAPRYAVLEFDVKRQ